MCGSRRRDVIDKRRGDGLRATSLFFFLYLFYSYISQHLVSPRMAEGEEVEEKAVATSSDERLACRSIPRGVS